MTCRIKNATVFISYAREDTEKVFELYQGLLKFGFTPWMDKENIPGGAEWKLALKKAIWKSHFCVICLSRNSIRKRGVFQEEIKEALDVCKQKLEDDIYLIPVKIDKLDDEVIPWSLSKFQWIGLYDAGGFQKLIRALYAGLMQLEIVLPIQLRSHPVLDLTEETVIQMLKDKGFYDDKYNLIGKGIQHLYEEQEINGDKIIIDHTTDLIWQQSGSDTDLTHDQRLQLIDRLNLQGFAGFSDWRLPTIEEAMSLIEARKSINDGLYISSFFEKKQSGIWTSDSDNDSRSWVVVYSYGRYYLSGIFYESFYFVRAVRSGV